MKLKKYSKYKNSGIDWIGEIPEDWEIVRYKFFYKSNMGQTIIAFDLIDNGKYPVLSATEKNHYFGRVDKTSYHFILNKGDFVIPARGNSIGYVTFVNERCVSTQTTIYSKCVNKKIIDNRFIHYYLFYNRNNLFPFTNTAIPQLTVDEVKENPLLIPPLQTQQKISSFLDTKTSQIEELIKKDKKLIELLKERRVSLINKAVTKGIDWRLNKFKHLFNFSKGLNITKENLEDEGIPCVNYGEIHSKYGFELDPERNLLKCVSEDYLKISRISLLKKGDFIFSDTSEDLKGSGNFTYLNSDIKTFAGYHTVIARHIGNINSRFFAYFFDSELFRSQIRKVVKGVKVYSITNSILNDTLIWYPERTLQDDIVIFLDRETVKIDNHVKKVESRIKLYEEYKKSLIYNVVTGKVEV